ncbi:MAG: hypothetical protein IMW91_10545 [Firmicutes bacterium]|nr:hypothetical protein [Bacillota bacterium]
MNQKQWLAILLVLIAILCGSYAGANRATAASPVLENLTLVALPDADGQTVSLLELVDLPGPLPKGAYAVPLPPNARGVKLQGEMVLPFHQIAGSALFDTAVPPSGLHLALVYQVPSSASSLPLTFMPAYDVKRFQLLLPQQGPTVASDQLSDAGWTQVQGIDQPLHLYIASDLKANTDVGILLVGLRQQAAENLPPLHPAWLVRGWRHSALAPYNPHLFAGVVAAAIAAVVVLLVRRHRRISHVRSEQEVLQERKVALYDALMALRESVRAGEVGEREAEVARALLLRALYALDTKKVQLG